MDRLTQKDIEELDIEFLLEREGVDFRVSTGVSGTQLNIRKCPNPECGDEKWKTYFGIENGSGNCFKCGKGFSKVSFIKDYFEHGSYVQTFELIRQALREQGWRPKRKAFVRIDVGEVTLPLSTPLPDDNGVYLPYLEQRGIPPDLSKYFGLRFCQYGWWRFNDMEKKQQLQDFSNRLIIPVCDLDGAVKTFQGRDLSGKSDRKYLFPKELPGTGRYLLNGHNFHASSRACMGEGFFDIAAIKLAMDEEPDLRGVTPIGSFGKHLSYGDKDGNDQLGRLYSLMTRGLKEMTIMWDGEVNALIAALNAAKKLTGIGLSVRIALLPFEKDPNEVAADVVRKAFYNAKSYSPSLSMQWRMQNPYSTPALRKRYGVQ